MRLMEEREGESQRPPASPRFVLKSERNQVVLMKGTKVVWMPEIKSLILGESMSCQTCDQTIKSKA